MVLRQIVVISFISTVCLSSSSFLTYKVVDMFAFSNFKDTTSLRVTMQCHIYNVQIYIKKKMLLQIGIIP